MADYVIQVLSGLTVIAITSLCKRFYPAVKSRLSLFLRRLNRQSAQGPNPVGGKVSEETHKEL